MIFGPNHEYKVGDDAWIYVGSHEGEMSKGAVVAILDLPGWSSRHYVVELPTPMDPLLEVRDCSSMRPNDPRLTAMMQRLVESCGLNREDAQVEALELLKIADGDE